MATALVTPETSAMAECCGTMAGLHARLDAAVGARGDAQELDAIAHVLGRLDVGLA